jgi:MYXO-CTERM domain-containing protein
MKCSGLHCQGCGHRGGNAGIGAGGVLALIVLAAIVAKRRAIGHAASVAVHVLEVAAEIAAGLAAAVAVTAAVLVIRRRAARRAAATIAAPEYAQIPASVRVLAPSRKVPAELPAPEPSGHLRWPYVTRDGRRAQ